MIFSSKELLECSRPPANFRVFVCRHFVHNNYRQTPQLFITRTPSCHPHQCSPLVKTVVKRKRLLPSSIHFVSELRAVRLFVSIVFYYSFFFFLLSLFSRILRLLVFILFSKYFAFIFHRFLMFLPLDIMSMRCGFSVRRRNVCVSEVRLGCPRFRLQIIKRSLLLCRS